MIKVGTDIVEVARFLEMKNLELFIKKMFTNREAEHFSTVKNPHESIAGAFAAKEAFAKYAGSGFRGFGFHDIEILHDDLGKPYLCFMGRRLDADVSISHSDTTATATVCGEQMNVSAKNVEFLKCYHALLPKRRNDMHKGDCGSVFVVAGSVGMVGAACLCSMAAIRSGSGLVTLATPECVQPQAAIKLNEVMTMPLACQNGGISKLATSKILDKLSSCDVCAIGPGLGLSDDISSVLSSVLSADTPCVIDADALNALSLDMKVLKNKNCDTVLTPHPKEMSRLTGLSVNEIESDRKGAALSLAKEYSSVVVLKGHETIVAAPNGEFHINTTGNSGMASGGMGDVLTGIIASYIGQGVTPYNAAILGVFLHGLAGDIAADEIGEFGIIASDVLGKLPYAIKSISLN